MKNKFQNWTKNALLTGIGLCGLCCVLPLIGVALGIGGLSVVAFYLEKISLGILVIGLLLLLFWQIQKRWKKPCQPNCSCQKHQDSTSVSCEV